ncbi:MAG: ThiF family adenylyltransferase [Candidatus Firestonebacteria bacterium]
MIWDKITERQKGILNFDDNLNNFIKITKVAVFGTGGNGNVLDFLVRLGYQNFNIVDFDKVEESNLNRLPFFKEQAGLPKAAVWEKYLKTVNPGCKIIAHDVKLGIKDAELVEEMVNWSDITAICVSDLQAAFIISRACAKMKKRMILGPGTANCWVVTSVLHNNNVTLESVMNLGTEKTALSGVKFEELLPKMIKMYYFPGRKERIYPDTLARVLKGEIAPRSCKIFVSMVNSAMSWEIVKNTAVMNGLPLEGTSVIEFPIVQIFDPYKGSAFYWNVQTEEIGIPNWITGKTIWEKYSPVK